VSFIAVLGFIDTHCHLNLEEFDHDRDQVITRALEKGITRILTPGIDIDTSKTAIKCAREFDQVYAAVGVHPNNGLSWTNESILELKQLAGEQKVVAIGEIGLDYYREYTPRELQRSIFSRQLEFAEKIGYPVIVHNRDASDDITDLLINWQKDLKKNQSKLTDHPGVLHSFSGSVEMAAHMAAHHFKIGISGPVTFRKAQNVQAVVVSLPLESIFIETDAPFQTPSPYRGKRNEPSNVRIVAEKIAELKAIPLEQVAQVTTQEADKLFNWREIH
jgi:TatD DNase family protein